MMLVISTADTQCSSEWLQVQLAGVPLILLIPPFPGRDFKDEADISNLCWCELKSLCFISLRVICPVILLMLFMDLSLRGS